MHPYSRLIHACFSDRGGQDSAPARPVPIVIPNVAGGGDWFVFGMASQLRNAFGWVSSILGHGTLKFDEGGSTGHGLIGERLDRLQTVYQDFFRTGASFPDCPAVVWVLGCVPYIRGTSAQNSVIEIHEAGHHCDVFKAEGSHRHGELSLGLLNGRRVHIPAGLVAPPERKLNQVVIIERSRQLREVRTGRWLRIRQNQQEVVLGTPDNAAAQLRGDFWEAALDPDVVDARVALDGSKYHRSITLRFIRLSPCPACKPKSAAPYLMDQVFISLRTANGCPSKIGTIVGDFDCNAEYHPEWTAAIREFYRRQNGGNDAWSNE